VTTLDEERRERWLDWETKFWAAVENEFGGHGSGGAARQYQGVWVMVSSIDVGVVNVGICRSPAPGEARVRGYSFNAHWETDPADGVADWAIRYAKRTLEDAKFFGRGGR
jgi:hypothetical protein